MKFNRSDISEAFGVSMPTIDEWRRKGCPCVQVGRGWEYTVKEVSDWLRGRDIEASGILDLSQERAKLTHLQAEKVSLELEQQRGNLLPVEMVTLCWQAMLSNCRAKLLALPPKAAIVVSASTNYLEIEGAVRNLVYEALTELAGDGIPNEYKIQLDKMASPRAT